MSPVDGLPPLRQLLKALKQKLHEKEEVLLGRTQVINVLQGEVDGRDQRIKVRSSSQAPLWHLRPPPLPPSLWPPGLVQDLTERLHRLQVERESLESKMEAEKHVMRAQLRDMMEQHRAQMAQQQQQLLEEAEQLRSPAGAPVPRLAELEGRRWRAPPPRRRPRAF